MKRNLASKVFAIIAILGLLVAVIAPLVVLLGPA